MRKLKVTFAGQYHPNFIGDQKAKFQSAKRQMEELAAKWDFELFVYEKELYSEKDAKEAAKAVRANKTDFLMLFSAAFSSGLVVEALAESAPYLGCWALPESQDTKTIEYNALCCVNMNISILRQYMTGLGLKAKWFFGEIGDELFEKRFFVTVRALTALANLKGARIGLIGGIASGFDNQYCDERKIYERFGVKVLRNLEFSDVKNKALSYSQEEITPLANRIVGEYCCISDLAKETLEKQARVYRAYLDLAQENSLDAIAGNCWPKFRAEMGMVPCAVYGLLNQEGMPTACEGDIYGAITQLAMSYISRIPSVVMDLTNFDFNDDSILLWHCGVGCKQLAKDGELKLERQFNPSYVEGKGKIHFAPAAEMVFDKMSATVARFTGEGEKLFVLSGEFAHPEKHSYDGARGWLFDLKLNGQDIVLKDLMSTVFASGLQHHLAVGRGDMTDELLELAAWLDIKPLEKTGYQNYLQW